MRFLREAGHAVRRISLLDELPRCRSVAVLDDGIHGEALCKALQGCGICVATHFDTSLLTTDRAAVQGLLRKAGGVLPLVMPFEIPFETFRACCELDTRLFSLNDFGREYLVRQDDHTTVLASFSDETSRRLYEQIAYCRMNPMLELLYLKSSFADYAHPLVHVERGDTVFCAGAFEGHTAMDYCEAAGGDCSVYAFEPMPQNCVAAKRNIAGSRWRDKITLEESGLYSHRAELTFLYASGASYHEDATMCGGREEVVVPVTDLDGYVQERGLGVDLLQLDIEGAEMDALRGARQTILRHKPRLQLCIYHTPTHFWDVPLFVLGLGVEYELFLGHHSPFWADTVLYAR